MYVGILNNVLNTSYTHEGTAVRLEERKAEKVDVEAAGEGEAEEAPKAARPARKRTPKARVEKTEEAQEA